MKKMKNKVNESYNDEMKLIGLCDDELKLIRPCDDEIKLMGIYNDGSLC